jgi:hypothetical protein
VESVEGAGVIAGCDESQEWLLYWFYSHFRKHNPTCPIAFADFGMSSQARKWCLKHGTLFKVPELSNSIPEQSGFSFQGDLWEEWKLDRSQLWPERLVWNRKPLAIAQSPFERTLWLDLDCQVRGDLTALLSTPLSSSGMGATPSNDFFNVKILSNGMVFLVEKFNSGVILTNNNSILLKQAASLIYGIISFHTEERFLSFLADKNQLEITRISHQYNWPVHSWGENGEAIIYHWLGKAAKIRLKSLINSDFTNPLLK